MKPKLDTASRLILIKRHLKGEKVSALCRHSGISRQLFYRWLKKYNRSGLAAINPGNGGRPLKPKTGKSLKLPATLSAKARGLMLHEVLVQGATPTEVAKRYGISRPTYYKWLKRYNSSAGNIDREAVLLNKKPAIKRYFRQTPEKYEQAILSLVREHPEYGIRSLVFNLPKVGHLPIVGHHGVQNVLKRNGLLTYVRRLEYSKAQRNGISVVIRKILVPVFSFFNLNFGLRSKLIKYSGTLVFSAFLILVSLGAFALFGGSLFSGPESQAGIVFALLALFMGSVFFLYSLKYYLTLAIVLSYSQDGGVKQTKDPAKDVGGFWNGILGLGNVYKSSPSSAGLLPDISDVRLNNKPFISVQIPFYNEKNVVERAIRASAGFKYDGEYEVILCDDSTDETSSIITRYQKDCLFKNEDLKITNGEGWTLTEVELKPGVKLKHIKRTNRFGYKGKALELALKLCDPRTEFVAVFDADFVPYPDSLQLFLKYFKAANGMSEDYSKCRIAAVQGYQWHVLNKSENWITRGIRGEYSGSYVIERSGAEIYGGLKQISGSVYMIQKKALAEIGWGTSITEDFELTLRLYAAGYKVLYTPYVQAPAECVSTVKRLIRQRMRWAEGHSFNVKKMFRTLIVSQNLTFSEKMEFLYLSPYYLQAFFFLVGTAAWLISETVFRTQLPFWSELWGWSLVLTNMFALPLLNSVGLFVEESEDRDYLGIASFMALSYLLVPFQAYASVKGLIEKEEGPWFRTPKTGRITDIFARGKFYRFISGLLPGGAANSGELNLTSAGDPEYYLNLNTANSRFDNFNIQKQQSGWVGNLLLTSIIALVCILSYGGSEIETGSLSDLPISANVQSTDVSRGSFSAYFKDILVGTVKAGSGNLPALNISSVNKIPAETILAVTGLALSLVLFALIFLAKRNRKVFLKAVKFTFTVFLIGTWLLSGWPVIWNSPRFPPRIGRVEAAQVTIDSTVSTSAVSHNGSSPTTVFTSATTGYTFYHDSGGSCVYVKTSNGGSSWGTPVTVSSNTACVSVAIWFDQWTPGDGSGTLIHIATIDSTDDDIFYATLNTSGDSLSSIVNITSGLSYAGTLAAGANTVSITKATDGVIYAATADASAMILTKCSTTCTTAGNWSNANPGSWTAGNDFVLVAPLSSGDIMLVWWDISATTNDIKSNIYDGANWAGFVNVDTALDNTTYDAAYGIAVDRSNNDLYLAFADSADTLGTNDSIFVKKYASGSWSALTNVVTASACAGGTTCGITDVKISRDDATDRTYVSYAAQSTAGTATTGNVYYKYSTDNGSTWSSESGPLYSANADIYGARLSLTPSSLLYATWYETNLDDLFGRPIAPQSFSQSAYRFYENTDSADVGATLAAQDTAVTLSSSGQQFRLRMLVHVDTADMVKNGHNFRLEYIGKGTGTCSAPSGGTPSSWTAVTTGTAIAYNDNATPANGAALTSNAADPTHGAHTVHDQTYVEANNFTNGVINIETGEDANWDFSLKDNGGGANTTYCLRAVESDGTVLGTYSVIPEFTTVPENPLILLGLTPFLIGFIRKRNKNGKKANI